MDRKEIHSEHASEIAFQLIDIVQSVDLTEEFMDSILGPDDRDYDDRMVALLEELTYRLREKPERFIGAVEGLIDFFEDMETDPENIGILCILRCIREKAEFHVSEEGRSVETITIDAGEITRVMDEFIKTIVDAKGSKSGIIRIVSKAE